MFKSSWFRRLRKHLVHGKTPPASTRRSGPKRPSRLVLEVLEDRLTPSGTVTNLNDSGTGSLRDALSGGGEVYFQAGLSGTIVLASTLTISSNTTINGPGAATVAVSGNNSVRDFVVSPGVTASISGLTIENGNYLSVAGVFNQGTLTLSNAVLTGNMALYIGAIYNSGTMTLNNSTLSDNYALSLGGGIYNSGTMNVSGSTFIANSGGAINNNGTMTLNNSTLSENASLFGIFQQGTGGAIDNNGAMTVNSSTVSGNTASTGGGIDNNGTLTLSNSTLFGNATSGLGGGVFNNGTLTVSNSTLSGNTARYSGGGVCNAGSLTVANTIVAGNNASGSGPDVYGTIATANYDLIGNTSGTSISSGGNNQVNVSADLASALAYNGGTTQSLGLLPGSTAIGTGDPSQAGTTAQNGVVRPAFPDIGAYQHENWIVTDPNGNAGSGSAADVTLPYAVANSFDADSITFAAGLSGDTITLNSTLAIGYDYTITGLGAADLAVSGNNAVCDFVVSSGATASISGLTIENGYGATSGGGVDNQGTLTLSNSMLAGNSVGYGGHGGSGVFNNATAILNDDTFTGNEGPDGAGFLNYLGATATVDNCTFFGNTANFGGAIFTFGTSTITMADDTISGNTANGGGYTGDLFGGGIWIDGFSDATASMDNTIIAGNTGGDTFCGTAFAAVNYSLIGNTYEYASSSGANNQLNVSAGLASALAYNGGATPTLALLPGSAAFGAGDPGQAGTTAQNGVYRPTAAPPDIGAYQHVIDVYWLGGSGDWDTASNWSTGSVPGPDNNVFISGSGITVTHSLAVADSVSGITCYTATSDGGPLIANTLSLSSGTLSIVDTPFTTASSITVLTISGGTADFSSGAAISIGTLTESAGTLTGSDTVTGAMLWTGGTISGTGTTDVANTGTLTMSGSGSLNLDGALENDGTGSWTGNWTMSMDGGTLTNDGTLTADSGQSLYVQGVGGVNDFVNNGTFIQQGGGTTYFTGSTSISGPGTVEFGAGTVHDAGTYNVTGTTLIDGGTADFSGSGAAQTNNLTLSSGTLAVSNGMTVTGAMLWTGGTISGTGTVEVASTGTLTMSGSGSFNLDGALQNDGMGNWTGNCTLGIYGTFTNDGSLLANSTQTLAVGGVGVFVNNGTFIQQGSGLTYFYYNYGAVAFNNAGTVNVDAGTLSLTGGGSDTGGFSVSAGTLGFDGGTTTLGSGSSVSVASTVEFGAGTVHDAGTYNVTGTTLIDGGTADFSGSGAAQTNNLTLSSGTLAVSNGMTVTGAMLWTGGTISGTGTVEVASTGTLTMSGSGSFNLDGALQNDGMGSWTGSCTMGIYGTFTNDGSLLANSTQTLAVGGVGVFVNNGTFTQQGSGLTYFYYNYGAVAFNNAGTVNVDAGTLSLAGGGSDTGGFSVSAGTLGFDGGTTTLGSGSSVSVASTVEFGAGTVHDAGTYNVTGTTLIDGGTADFSGSGAAQTNNLTLSSGTLAVSNGMTVTGAMLWTGGTISGTGTIEVASTGTLTMSGSGTFNVDGALQNDGMGSWTGSCTLGIFGTFTNDGSLLANSTQTLAVGGVGVFVNNGTFTQQGSGLTYFYYNYGAVAFNNAGTVNVDAGTLSLTGGGSDTGGFSVSAGTLGFDGGTTTLGSGSSVSVASTVEFGAGTVHDAGTYNVTGTTLIDGGTADFSGSGAAQTNNLTLSSGTLAVSNGMTVTGAMLWTGGTISGTGTVEVASTGTLTMSGSGSFNLDGALQNDGMGSWTGNCTLGIYGTFTNDGSLVANSTQTLAVGGVGVFVNNGTFTQQGSGLTYFYYNYGAVAFNNAGTVNVDAGTLSLAGGGSVGGSYLIAAGANLSIGSDDLTPPSAAFPSSFTNSSSPWSATFSGTAEDNTEGTTLASVGVSLFNGSYYWNGTAFASSTQIFNAATLSGNDWSFTIPVSDFASNTGYTVQSQALDNTSGVQTSAITSLLLQQQSVPTVTGLTPASGLVGGGTTVIITGTGFTGATAVNFGGNSATTFTVNSATQIAATDPAGSGEVDVTVVTAGGTSATSSADQFTYNAAATTSLTSNPVGPITQGTSVTFTADITGSPSVGTVSFYFDYGQSDQFQIGGAVNVAGGSATSDTTTALPAGSDTITAIYSGGVGFAGSQGTVTIQVTSSAPPPSISSVVINQDISALYNAAGQPSPGTQRSMVDDVVYTFSEAVSILSPSVDPNVFTIAVASGWTGTVPTLAWAPIAGSGNTEWAVSFSGASVTGGSIANGAYTITVADPGSITAVSDGPALSLGDSGIGSATQSFYRLFGDINGDEVVNAADNLKFKQALTTYNAAFDYNDDGTVNAADNLKFKNDLTLSFSGFTTTI